MEKQKRKLILEDGSVYLGTGFGSMKNKKAELVFNTSMAGYQEILSDPSYTGQAVVMTYPLIGNYGMCDDDYETDRPSIYAMVVREYCETPSNFRCTKTLGQVMEEYDIAGIEGIDTRKLARHIREFGSCKVSIVNESDDTEAALAELKAWEPAKNYVSQVSTKAPYEFELDEEVPEPTLRVAVIDCGIKKNILREMRRKGMALTVFPWNTPAEEICKLDPDGIFLSNGPGDPVDVKETVETVKNLRGRYPIFGICLGHQMISLAYGAMTYKLKFGHRGGNHPVKNLLNDRLEITSQNHSYAVKEETLQGTPLEVTHVNLLDMTIEGMRCEKDHVFSVQYHPESAPGPQDSSYLFDEFKALMTAVKEEKHA